MSNFFAQFASILGHSYVAVVSLSTVVLAVLWLLGKVSGWWVFFPILAIGALLVLALLAAFLAEVIKK